MIEFEWEKKAKRADAAKLLRELADSLSKGSVELERDGWDLKLEVPNDVELGIELEAGDDGTELEIELKWSSKPAGGAAKSSG